MDRKQYIQLLNTIIDSKDRQELNNNIRLANEFIRENNLSPDTPEFKKIDTVVGLMKVKIKNKRKMEFESVQDETLLELKKKELISMILESEEKNYTDKKDYTKAAQKVLEKLLPNKIKYVKGLEVLSCFTAKDEHEWGGGFSYTNYIIHLDIKFYIDKQPWIDAGFDISEEGTNEMGKIAYGKDFFEILRDSSHEVREYLSIDSMYRDWQGTMSFKLV